MTDGLPKGVRCLADLGCEGLLAAGSEGLFRREVRGGDWIRTVVHFATGVGDERDLVRLTADPYEPCRLLGITAEGRLLRSGDCGVTWNPLLEGLPVRVREAAWGLREGEIMLATSRGVLGSHDGGGSWRWFNNGLRRIAVQSVAVGGESGAFYLGTNAGLYARSAHADTWSPAPASGAPSPYDEHGPSARYSGASGRPADLSSDCLAGGHDPDVWRRLGSGIVDLDLLEDPETGFALLCVGSENGLVVCTRDVGAADPRCGWNAPGPARPTTAVLALPVGAVWASGGQDDEMWAGWGLPDGQWRDADISAICPSLGEASNPPAELIRWSGEHHRDVLMAAGGLVGLAGELCERIQAPADAGRVLSAVTDETRLWIGTENGLWRSTDGVTWEQMAFPGQRVGRVVVAAGRPGMITCRIAGEIRLSVDEGGSWTEVPVPAGLPVLSMALDREGQRLYLGTSHGLFVVAPPPEVQPGAQAEPLDLVRPLEAYPNPFSSQVLVRGQLQWREIDLPPTRQRQVGFDSVSTRPARFPTPAADGNPDALASSGAVATGGPVELLIINVHGQLVRRLETGILSGDAAEGALLEWSWDGRNERGQEVPNGIYLVSTRVGRIGFRGKLMKLR